MSSRPVPVRLPDDAERLLSEWPAPERDEAFWEQLAQGAEARFSLTPQGSTPDMLLAAPLPVTAEELAAEAAPPPRADVTPLGGAVGSLTELARARVAQREKEAKELAGASLALASQVRRERPRPVQAPEPTAPAAERSVPPPAPAESAARQGTRGAERRLPWIGGGLAVLVAAAAGAIVVMRPAAKPEPAVANGAEAAAPVKPVAPAVVSQPTAASPPAPEPSPGISPEQLPTAEQLAARAPERAAAAPKKAREPIAAAPPPPVAKPATPAAPVTDELPPNPKLKLADDDERPSRPSTGAVISAVGAVMGGARACVAGHEGPSRASLVFGSDGRVQSVEITGPAAGTPAEGCIKAALSSARVQPFAEDSFSIAVPVRP